MKTAMPMSMFLRPFQSIIWPFERKITMPTTIAAGYVPAQIGSATADRIEALRDNPDASGKVRRQETTGQGHSIHFYSRGRDEIRAENLRTLALIKEAIGSSSGMSSLERFARQLREARVAGLNQGDRWETLSKNVQNGSARHPVALTSTTTPAGQVTGGSGFMARAIGFSKLVKD
jgi:hypothetical protein